MLRRMRRVALIALCLLACEANDAAEPSSGGYDTPVDPAALDALDPKADGAWCDGVGGPQDGGDLLVLVNKRQGLRADYAPTDLVPLAEPSTGTLRYGAALAFEALIDAALVEAGIEFRVRSGYRGYRTQCRTFAYWVEQKGLEHALRYSAAPGTSQHQLGTTADLTGPAWGDALEPWVAETPEAAWLFANAPRFGLALSYPEGAEAITGYAFEPWHYRYIGEAASNELADADLLLEEYLSACAAGTPALTCPRATMPPRPLLPAFIGSPCAAASDCALLGEAAVCLTDGHPDGYCSQPCDRACPDAPGAAPTFCAVELDGAAWCRSQCDFDQFPLGCREGYTCLDGQRPNLGATADVCRPER